MNVKHLIGGPQRLLTHLIFAGFALGSFGFPLLSGAGTPQIDPGGVTNDDAGIVRAVRTRLEALHLDSVTNLDVAADTNGMVRLTGTAASQEAADRAIEAARNADGVEFVKGDIVVVRTAQ